MHACSFFFFFFLFQSLIVSVYFVAQGQVCPFVKWKHCRKGSQVPGCLTEALPSFLEAFAMVISSLTKEVNETRPREIVHS